MLAPRPQAHPTEVVLALGADLRRARVQALGGAWGAQSGRMKRAPEARL